MRLARHCPSCTCLTTKSEPLADDLALPRDPMDFLTREDKARLQADLEAMAKARRRAASQGGSIPLP